MECFCQKILLKITTRISLSVIIIYFWSNFLLKIPTNIFIFAKRFFMAKPNFLSFVPIYLFDSKCIFCIWRNQSRNIIEMQYFRIIFAKNHLKISSEFRTSRLTSFFSLFCLLIEVDKEFPVVMEIREIQQLNILILQLNTMNGI